MEYITVAEVCAEFRVVPLTIYRAIKGGKLKAVKIGKEYRIRREDLDRYLNRE